MNSFSDYDIESEIFSNEEVFGSDYQPDVRNYRNKQLTKMRRHTKDLNKYNNPKNFIIHGAYATGKTSTINQFLDELNLHFDKVKIVYINCSVQNTLNKVYSVIYKTLYSQPYVKYGVNNTILSNQIQNYLFACDSRVILVFDDLDKFQNNSDLNSLFGEYLKIHETDSSVKITIHIVTNFEEKILKPDILSNFKGVTITFDSYDYDQMFHILKERCQYGFKPRVITDDLIKLVATKAFGKNDLRYGITLLSEAGEKADEEGASKILKEHIVSCSFPY